MATVVGSFGPTVAAVVVRLFVTKEGLRDKMLHPRPGKAWPYYLVGVFWPLLIVAAFIIFAPLLGLGSSGNVIQEMIGALLAAVVLSPIFMGEEYGWRGFLQGRISPGRPLLAALSTGLIWGVWHLPAVAVGLVQNEHGWLSMALFPIYTILFSVILGWLTLRSQTIWPAVLAHSSNNMVLPALGSIFAFTGGNGDVLFSVQGQLLMGMLGIICLAIVVSGHMKARSVGDKPVRATEGVEW
jgi:membrane protease YdiL (CAAX protease family)